MAERKRSHDLSRDTEDIPAAEAAGTVSQGGRSGGNLQRDIASRDEEKRAVERPAGRTGEKKSDEKGPGR